MPIRPARITAAVIAATLGLVLIPGMSVAASSPAADVGPVGKVQHSNIGLGTADDRFLITVDPGPATVTATTRTRTMAARVAAVGGTMAAAVTVPFDGYVVSLPNRSAAAQLRTVPGVRSVIPDRRISVDAIQSPTPSWGLDQLDESTVTLDDSFHYPNSGAGTIVYVIDTGIRSDHAEFTGRILPGAYTVDDGRQVEDCNGHGTHVAGTAVGSSFGVAKGANVVPVRILDCAGAGYISDFVVALNWIADHHPAGVPGVINASLGGGYIQEISDAVDAMTAAGFVTVVAAGNSNSNACWVSPASAPSALTVASVANNGYRSVFSNAGPCVDLFAPGSDITSAYDLSPTSTMTMSGTSMASPHVAGIAASVWQRNPTFTAEEIITEVKALATPDIVANVNGSPNLLARMPYGTPDAPVTVAAAQVGSTLQVTWGTPTWDGGDVTYHVDVAVNGGPFTAHATVPGGAVPGATMTTTFANGVNQSVYQFQVTAHTPHGSSAAVLSPTVTYTVVTPPPPTLAVVTVPGVNGTVTAAPRPSLTVSAAPRLRVKTGTTVRLRFVTFPAQAKTLVTLASYESKTWRNVTSARVSSSRTVTFPTVRVTKDGTWLVRLQWGSTSRYLRLHATS